MAASGGGGGGGGSNQACAACKYQRRKCSPDCPLSPYFPPDQPKRFHNVHKLFGVSNILRILKLVDPAKREDTVKSIVYEADTREKDPVHGCLGVISLLQSQMVKLKEELVLAREQLFILQQQQQLQQQMVAFAGGHEGLHPGMLAYQAGPGQESSHLGPVYVQAQQEIGRHSQSQCGGFAGVRSSHNSLANSFVDTRHISEPFMDYKPVYNYAEKSAGVGAAMSCHMQPAVYLTRHRHHAIPCDQDMKTVGVYLSLTNN